MALDEILRHKHAEVAARRAAVSLESHLAACTRSDRDFAAALRGGRPGFILEIKFASPSAGTIRTGADLGPVLEAYGRHADAISVLTDQRFFGGALERLSEARRAVAQPLLAKDFFLGPYQVAEARRHGADAILLILAAIDDTVWRECAALAESLGMAVLTEAHSAEDVERAVTLGAGIIGINNRDLRTLLVDPATVSRLASRVPADRLVVAESGLDSREAVTAVRPHADAVLVGTALMREADLDRAVRRLVYGRTKICGLTSADDARSALAAGATHGGLVFVTGSPRRLEPRQAAAVREGAPLQWVGLFADLPPEDVARQASALSLSAVQLYGYDRTATERVRRALPPACEAWSAVRVKDRAPPREATGADRLLLDAAAEGMLGGSGRRFDWELVEARSDRAELVLAGGIDESNAARASALGTWALDLSSGVESAPGRKDPARLRGFFRARRKLPGRGDAR